MKIARTPSLKNLKRAYDSLQVSKIYRPEDLITWSLWARLDPRLAEILIHFFAKHFQVLDPIKLWTLNRACAQPQGLALILSFSRRLAKSEFEQDKYLQFEIWQRAVLTKVKKGPLQKFFITDGKVDPTQDQKELTDSLQVFLKWGFFGAEDLLHYKTNGKAFRKRTSLPKDLRLRKLRQLMAEQSSICLDDYLRACQGLVHRRTAERDLESAKWITAKGNTRAKRYSQGR